MIATPEERRGFIYGVFAYGIWGLLPLYWRLVDDAGAIEVLAHRFVWALVVIALLLVLWPRPGWWAALRARPASIRYLTIAAFIIAVNWGFFIWGVQTDRVVETSLGYFINPLVTVIVGVVIFHERLRRGQWLAIGVAAAAVTWLTIDHGSPPWIAFGLAATFATYGALKKKAATGAVQSLAVETSVITPFALGYLVWLQLSGDAMFGPGEVSMSLLLAAAGLATAIPLLFFASAATRIPLTILGLLQYLAPTLQFLLGVLVFGEPMPPERFAGFVIIWIALAIFTTEGLLHQRKLRRLA